MRRRFNLEIFARRSRFVVFPLLKPRRTRVPPRCISRPFWVTLVGKIMLLRDRGGGRLDLVWGYAGILSLGPRPCSSRSGGYAHGHVPGCARSVAKASTRPTCRTSWCFSTGRRLALANGGMSDQFPVGPCCWWCWSPGCSPSCSAYFAVPPRGVKGRLLLDHHGRPLTFAAMLLFFRNNTGPFGGNKRLQPTSSASRLSDHDPRTRMALFVITAAVLLGALALGRWLVRPSKIRPRACPPIPRDAEQRANVPAATTPFITSSPSSRLLGGAVRHCPAPLYVPQVGIINPSEMSPANSIEDGPSGWRSGAAAATLLGAVSRRRAG